MDKNEVKQTELLLFSNIKRHVKMNAFEEKQLTTFFTVNHVLKKTELLVQGNLCKKFYFVEKGSLRAYHINNAGKESKEMLEGFLFIKADMSVIHQSSTAN
ncbi:MAG: hypothetical protein AAFY00_14215, partial [Bacteroidota bacterium]